MRVLLSIKPEFAEKIFSGEKKFEYRKNIFKKEVDTVVVYSTMPVGKIVGEFTIDHIIEDEINTLWKKTKKDSGISEEFFKSYFSNKSNGYAIHISEAIEYSNPLKLADFSNDLKAPQSFCYID